MKNAVFCGTAGHSRMIYSQIYHLYTDSPTKQQFLGFKEFCQGVKNVTNPTAFDLMQERKGIAFRGTAMTTALHITSFSLHSILPKSCAGKLNQTNKSSPIQYD